MTYPQNLIRHGFSQRVVEPTGSGSSKVYLLGEAPGEQEDEKGRPFFEFAPAGATLERLLRRGGWQRDQFRIGNACWQRPPRNWLEGAPWEAEALETWRPFVEQDIASVGAKVVVALGNIALKATTMYGGKGASITNVAGYVIGGNDGRWVVPTYHPSHILQGEHRLSGAVIFAIMRALEIAAKGFERKPTRYVYEPSLDEMLEFERGFVPERHALSYDIETPESGHLDEEALEEEVDASYNIIRASLCYDATTGYAISFPWTEPFVTVAKRMLAAVRVRRVWNRLFDDPRLLANGVTLGGRCYDMMEGWSFLQRSLPRALAFVAPFYGWTGEPWKHISSSEPGLYSACDAHALQLIGDGVERDLRAEGRWERFESHVVEVHDILLTMAKNGLPYSAEKAKKFELELQAKFDERFAELQRVVPDELKPVKQKKGLTGRPRINGVTVTLPDEGERFHAQDGVVYVKRPFKELDEQKNIVTVMRWAQLEPFLPTSPQQVLALIKHFGHKAGTNRKTKKETSDEDTLDKLRRKCLRTVKEQAKGAVYQTIIECRQLNKVLGTYVKGWRPGKDGRIHATPGFWGQMYRISWRRPNIAATVADKREEYIAAGFRKCVAASPGKVLVEADWKGIEAVIVGWFAGDTDYMRLGRLGVHAYMTSLVLARDKKIEEVADLKWSDADLTQFFSELKKKFRFEYDQNKHGVHLSNYGGTPPLMTQQFPEAFPTMAAAKQWQDFYFDTVAKKVRAWQKGVLERAHQEVKLVNPWGYVMRFWNVYEWDSRKFAKLKRDGLGEKEARAGAWRLGEDAKSALSFLPRDTAAGMLKEVLLRLRPWAERRVLLASVHDSIMGELERPHAEEFAWALKTEMEKPVPELGGLSIGTDIKWGDVWDDDGMKPLVLERR